ncbi:hypothetical protein AMJ51_01185, partial [Microgenomates bacterium DG_75]
MEAGISRTLFYRWLKRYKKEGSVKPKKRAKVTPRRVSKEHVLKILEIVLAHPEWSSQKISLNLPKIDEKPIVGNHGVQNVLERLGLNTYEKRRRFVEKAKNLSIEESLKIAKGEEIEEKEVLRPALIGKELTPQQRLEMIERVVKYGENVSKVCLDFQISRPAFYKWLRRYQIAPEDKKLEALQDKKPKIERYYRQTPKLYEGAVLDVVAKYPQLGVKKIIEVLPQIAGKPIVGYHGVQKVLERHSLNTYEQRLAYAQAQITPTIRLIASLKELGTQFIYLPAEIRIRVVRFATVTFFSTFATTVILGFLGYLATISTGVPAPARIGFGFASIALMVGSVFFAYSMKYYFTLAIVLSFSRQPLEEGGGYAIGINGKLNNNRKNGNGGNWLQRIFGLVNGNGPSVVSGLNGRRNGAMSAGGLQPSLEHIKLKRYPFVSIHLPFYNEKKVAERILEACTAMDYPNYEVIICDDSTDETIEIVQKYAKKHNQTYPHGPKIRVLHRPTRKGFKGGALKYAVKNMDPRTEFCVVFDADFIPYPDTLELFIKYFKANNPLPNSRRGCSENYTKSNVAVIGGYQWHVLNKSENWVTRGVRTEYAGSYVIERPGREILSLMKQISGSVYMIRADVLKKIGWGTSITEDFQLTLKLYEQGYKVVYTPYVQAPAECVSTLKRLIRQRMRWSEGHSNCIKKMFVKLMTSPNLTLLEKLEVLYISPYYLQAFFFLLGTFSWLMAETVFRARLPFWTSLWGWSLVLTNFFSLPLLNAVGLFLEESEEKDYLGLLSFVALSYIMVPFQAYASVKGFLEREEGPWFRTPKTGRITDIFTRGKFYRWISGILPGRRGAPAVATAQANERYTWLDNPHVALATANNQFNGFSISRKRMRWVSKAILAVLLVISVTVFSLTRGIPEVLATNPGSILFLRNEISSVLTGTALEWRLADTSSSDNDSTTTIWVNNKDTGPAWAQYKPGSGNYDLETATTCAGNGADNAGWILENKFGSGGNIASGNWTFYWSETDNRSNNTGVIQVCVWRVTESGGVIGTPNLLFSCADTVNHWTGGASTGNFTCSQGQHDIGLDEYLYIEYFSNMTDIASAGPGEDFYSR